MKPVGVSVLGPRHRCFVHESAWLRPAFSGHTALCFGHAPKLVQALRMHALPQPHLPLLPRAACAVCVHIAQGMHNALCV